VIAPARRGLSHGPSTLLAVGETMAMFAPAVATPLVTASDFLLDAGGAESNVAAHVVALGHRARWFSRLGRDALGERIRRTLVERGIDVSGVIIDSGHPTGIYVKDPGAGVFYYRRGSAASHLAPADAQAVSLTSVDLLHVSGITAAISESAAEFLADLMTRARLEGVTVSFDVNHRTALWSAGSAADPLLDLARRADVVFVGADEAEALWGTTEPGHVRGLLDEVPELVVKDGHVGATTFIEDTRTFEATPPVDVVEAVGAGDAFAGGYLAGLLDDLSIGRRLRAGHARAALTLQTTRDSVGG
jgi:2-dehydro-3-deoxygluconokinase